MEEARQGLLLSLSKKERGGVGLLLSLLEKERGGEGEGKVGCPPCPIRTRGGAHASLLLASLLYSRMAQ